MDDKTMPCDRMHLTEDRAFFYSNCPNANCKWENIKISLAFHREVINYILPLVQPDLIHCHDWMTGLIPAIARDFGIPCIFTFQSHETAKSTLSDVEDMGIDAAAFWQNLYFDRFPFNYEETRKTNPIDFLLSGIFAAHCVNVADHAFFAEIGKVQNSYCKLLRQIIADKLRSGSAVVLSNSPVDTQQYLDLYGKMLQRPLIETKKDDYKSFTDDRHGSKNISEAFPKKQGISDSFNPVMVAG
jgi:starch synthase/alpha-amylase